MTFVSVMGFVIGFVFLKNRKRLWPQFFSVLRILSPAPFFRRAFTFSKFTLFEL